MKTYLISYDIYKNIAKYVKPMNISEMDAFMAKEYGLMCIDMSTQYEITDEKKFTAFLLKFG